MNASDGNNPWENNPSENNQPKKGKGRQKMTMEKIENETNLQVTFSKRRAGLFKKASELSTLCGAESAIVVFSPGEKAHSFGHPHVETIANKFLNTNALPRTTDPLLMAHNDATMRQRNQEVTNIEGLVEQERQRKREHDNLKKASQSQTWCPPCIDELNYEQLDQLQRSILSFKHNFETKINNDTSLENSYVQRSNPEAGIRRAPWTTPSGPSTGFPINSNFQGPAGQFHLNNYNAPMVFDGSTNSIGFNAGAGNPNVANQPNHMASSSSSSFVAPFDPSVGNFGFMVQYPYVAPSAGGSNVIIPYNYDNPGNVVPYSTGTTSSNLEPDGSPMETQADVQNKFQSRFNNNYRRRDS